MPAVRRPRTSGLRTPASGLLLPGPTGTDDCLLVALDSASPTVVDYPDGEATKKAHYLLRWVFQDGEKGPWSETVSATIGA